LALSLYFHLCLQSSPTQQQGLYEFLHSAELAQEISVDQKSMLFQRSEI